MVAIAKTSNKQNESKTIPFVQITFMETTPQNAAVSSSYGTAGSLPVGTKVLVLNINGNQNNPVIIPLGVTKGLKEGEFECGNFKVGSIIKFDEQGNILVNSTKDVIINQGSENAVKFQSLETIVQSILTQVNANLTAIQAQVPTYTPTPVVEDLTPAKVEKLKV